MKKFIFILFCLNLFFNFSLTFAFDQIKGKVVGISDGDTITILTDNMQRITIRLAQIDAPEKSQAFGQKSKQLLSNLVFGKNVIVDIETTDRYGRTVGTVFIDGLNINAEQIKQGMAWVYIKYAHDKNLYYLEEIAKNKKIGLWSDPYAIPPWEYRHQHNYPILYNPLEKTLRNSYLCGDKKKCDEMKDCDEAKFYFNKCGLTTLDKNHDGIPCENLCK